MAQIDFSKYYTKAKEQLDVSWLKICFWSVFWLFLFVITAHVYISRKQMFYFDLDSGNVFGETVAFYVIGIVLFIILSAIVFYSICGVIHRTDDDPDANFFTSGIQGLLHPLNALDSSLVFQLISAGFISIYVLASDYLGSTLGAGMGIISLILSVLCLLCMTNFALAWYKKLDDPDQPFFNAVKSSMSDMHGKAGELFILLLPAVLCIWLLGIVGQNLYDHYSEGDRIEIEFAETTLKDIKLSAAKDQELANAVNRTALGARERKSFNFLLSHEVYQKDVPEFSGDYKKYIHEMAEYGYQREVFHARRDNREISMEAQRYFNRPTSGKAWMLGSVVCYLLASLTTAFMLIVLLHFFREMNVSTEVMDSRKKENPKPRTSLPEQKKDEPASEEPRLIMSTEKKEDVIAQSAEDSKDPFMPDDLFSALKQMPGGNASPEQEESAPIPPEPEPEPEPDPVQTGWNAKVFSIQKQSSPMENEDIRQNSTPVKPITAVSKEAMDEKDLAEKKEAIDAWRNNLANMKKVSLRDRIRAAYEEQIALDAQAASFPMPNQQETSQRSNIDQYDDFDYPSNSNLPGISDNHQMYQGRLNAQQSRAMAGTQIRQGFLSDSDLHLQSISNDNHQLGLLDAHMSRASAGTQMRSGYLSDSDLTNTPVPDKWEQSAFGRAEKNTGEYTHKKTVSFSDSDISNLNL